MNLNKFIEELKKLPGSDKYYDLSSIIYESERIKKDGVAIEIGIATEIGALYAFNELNVNDTVFEGYASQYTRLSESQSLYNKALEESAEGTANFQGLVSGIKGKIFEINLEESLEKTYPGWAFSIAENPTQPVWDLKGIGPDGQEMLVQAKMGGAENVADVKARMLENPEVMFATSTEIQEKILESSSELSSQFINVDVSNSELTEEVVSNIEQLMANYGIDAPDDIADILPFIGEIIAGMRLLYELSRVKKDFKDIEISDKRRVQGLRAIMAFSRFGITAVVAASGSAIGSVGFPGVGTVLGGIGGAIAGMYINRKIKPYMYDWALMLMNLSQEELIYYRNKKNIDTIGQRLQNTRLMLE